MTFASAVVNAASASDAQSCLTLWIVRRSASLSTSTSSDAARKACDASMASRTASELHPRREAMSWTVGVRCNSCCSSRTTGPMRSDASCKPLGTRMLQTVRKCRRSSPRTVGAAKLRNGTPRSGSNRSTARSRPICATCSRSSSSAPRSRYRRANPMAMPCASARIESRTATSPVRRHSRNRSISMARFSAR